LSFPRRDDATDALARGGRGVVASASMARMVERIWSGVAMSARGMEASGRGESDIGPDPHEC